MAFLKYANAKLVTPFMTNEGWARVKTASKGATGHNLHENLIDRASEIFQKPFDPKKYLLSHCTIVSSVDTYAPKNVKLGSFMVDGFKITRKYPEFRITQSTQKYTNFNYDSWSREVLLKSYKTFIGAQNYLEHVQLEEQSKGRIIDAIARDLGESVYIDILIATELKHRDLISSIQNGNLSTLSMGALCTSCLCTKCGNVASDDSSLCGHIKFFKGNTFYDEDGLPHKYAEICGHPSIDEVGGNTFIEASWVRTPAFTGAVLRNLINDPTEEMVKKAQKVLSSPPPQWSDSGYKKAANFKAADWVDDIDISDSEEIEDAPEEKNDEVSYGEPENTNEGDSAPTKPEKSEEGLDKAEKDLENYLTDKVLKRIKDKMKKDTMDDSLNKKDSMAPNESLIKEASRYYKAAVTTLVKTASSETSFVDSLSQFHASVGVEIPVKFYRVALELGAYDKFASIEDFYRACGLKLGRKPNFYEVKVLRKISNLLSQVK